MLIQISTAKIVWPTTNAYVKGVDASGNLNCVVMNGPPVVPTPTPTPTPTPACLVDGTMCWTQNFMGIDGPNNCGQCCSAQTYTDWSMCNNPVVPTCSDAACCNETATNICGTEPITCTKPTCSGPADATCFSGNSCENGGTWAACTFPDASGNFDCTCSGCSGGGPSLPSLCACTCSVDGACVDSSGFLESDGSRSLCNPLSGTQWPINCI